jgi:hypothetical protein
VLDLGHDYRVYTLHRKERREMRRIFTALLGLVILFGGAGTSRAEVKRIEMRIAGYLCGN